MMDTLKLCVSCKACRHECPTGVDMAKMKIEVLAARAEKAWPFAARPAGRLSAALCGSRLPLRPARQLAQQQSVAACAV
jgi:Fe-S oxidoreductase